MSETTNEPAAAAAAPAITIDAPKAEAAPAAAGAASGFAARFAGMKPQLSRVSILAIAIAASAALGSMVGAIAGAAIVRSNEPEAPSFTASLPKSLASDLAALKSSIEAGNKDAKARAAQLAERIERAEKAAADPAKFAKLNETIDRLEKKASAPVAPETTGSIAAPKDARPPIVEGWTLRDVFDGRAMIESRTGLYEVGPGSNIPGLGRIETIRRVDGRWAVFTPRGIVVAR
jgi:hypothetical protein